MKLTTVGKFIAKTIIVTAHAFASAAGMAYGTIGALCLVSLGYNMAENDRLKKEKETQPEEDEKTEE